MQHVSLPEGWWLHATEQLSENPFLEDQTEGPSHTVLRKMQVCRNWGITWLEHHTLLFSLSVCKLETFIPDNNKQRCYLGCWLNLDAGFIWASWAKKKTSISFWMMRTLMTLCASAERESISQKGWAGQDEDAILISGYNHGWLHLRGPQLPESNAWWSEGELM